MIKLNDRFSFERDKFNWILYDDTESRDKLDNIKVVTRKSYHGNLTLLCNAVIERSAGECQSMEELKTLLKEADRVLAVHVGSDERVKRIKKMVGEA